MLSSIFVWILLSTGENTVAVMLLSCDFAVEFLAVFMKNENIIEILYTDMCPFWKETLKTVEEVVADLKAEVTIKKVKVSNERDAKRLKFPGSPTVRLNGVDVDPATKETAGYIGCRLYMFKGGTYESPPNEMIKSGLERMLKK